MAEAQQETLMRKVAVLTELVEAQYLKMASQSKSIYVQSVTITEQSAKLAELQGASGDARTGEPRWRSPATDAKLGAYSILGRPTYRATIPQSRS